MAPACVIKAVQRRGWPGRGGQVPCQLLHINARESKRKVEVSTVAVDDGGAPSSSCTCWSPADSQSPSVRDLLIARQREVLELLVDGLPAKVIATRLGVAEATIRTHIHAILVELGTHSQLEAIAKARGLKLVD